MNTADWTEYFKLEEGIPCPTNMVYVPLMNQDMSILCMDFGNSRITFDNTFFFNNEITYLEKFKNYSWAPEVLEIDIKYRKIFIKWYGETFNNRIYSGKQIDTVCPNWKYQLRTIITDIVTAKVYKMTIYPHCFYADSNGIMRTIDFYSCVDKANPYIAIDLVNHIIGQKSKHRWVEAIDGDFVNFELFFKNALTKHVEWPDDALKDCINE